MFWSKKKTKKDIKDPITTFGKIIREGKKPEIKIETKKGILDRIFRSGYDSGFVYYDE